MANYPPLRWNGDMPDAPPPPARDLGRVISTSIWHVSASIRAVAGEVERCRNRDDRPAVIAWARTELERLDNELADLHSAALEAEREEVA